MTKSDIVFIYGNDAKSRTEARRHVSKIVRKREREGRIKHTFVEQKICSRVPQCHQRSHQDTRQRHSQGCTAAAAAGSTSEELPDEAPPAPLVHLEEGGAARTRTPPPDRYLASRSHIDPFDTLSIPLTSQAARCLKHYAKDMPWVEFQIPMDSPIVPRIRSALEVPLTLYAMVAQGAVHRATLLGEKDNAVGEFHLGKATSLLRRALPDLTSDNWQELVQPMFELAFCEQGLGRPQNCRLHLNGLRQLINSFGGLGGLQRLPNIQLLSCHMLHAAEQPYFPLIRMSQSQLSHLMEHDSSLSPQDPTIWEQPLREAWDDLREHVEDLCWFLNQIERESSNPSPLLRLVHTFFEPSNRLSESLTCTANDKITPNKFGPRVLHRIASLLILAHNVLRHIQSGDQATVELYLEKLHFLYHPNVKLMKLRLMQDGMQVKMENVNLNWQVARMMQVYKVLDGALQQRIDATLVHFLQGMQSIQVSTVDVESIYHSNWVVLQLMPIAMRNLFGRRHILEAGDVQYY